MRYVEIDNWKGDVKRMSIISRKTITTKIIPMNEINL
jgi:hypothetical protein